MKLNELLNQSENQELDEFILPGLGLAARGAGMLFRGARNIPKNIPKVPVPRVPTNAGASRLATAQYNQGLVNKLGFSKDSAVGKWRIQSMSKAIQKRGIKARDQAIYQNMQAATAIQDKMANLGLKIVGTTTFLYSVYDYLMSRWALDPNDPGYNDQLTKLNGEFLMGFIVPKVIGGIGKITSGLVGGLMKMTGLPKAGEMVARWGRHVARVGEAAALVFLRTDEGKKWFAQTFASAMGLFTDAGYALEGLFKGASDVASDVADVASDFAKDPKGTADRMVDKVKSKLPKVHDAYADTPFPGSVTKMVPNVFTAKEGHFS
jgi:hypothetical protein